jgi:hypothetical protein
MPNGDLAVVFDATSAEENDGGPVGPIQDLAPSDPSLSVDKLLIALAKDAGTVPTGGPLAFAPPLPVADYLGNPVRGQRAGTLPTADVDPTTGTIFVGWESGQFRTDAANDAVVTYSTDEGTSWAPTIRVNGGPTNDNVDHYNTMLAVGTDHTLRVAYRVRQETASADVTTYSPRVDTYYQQARDITKGFTPALKVNSVRSDVDFAAFSRGGAFHGDYNQLAVAGSKTYVVRCESYSTVRGEPRTWPPTVHHQRTWVAVLGGG